MQELNVAAELYPVHRLDSGTEGVCVLGKMKAFATEFGRMMALSSTASGDKPMLQKTYLALAPEPAPVGMLRHIAEINTRMSGLPPFTLIVPPTAPQRNSRQGVECVLEILEVQSAFLYCLCWASAQMEVIVMQHVAYIR